jgi:4-alpha-glucanotransferase
MREGKWMQFRRALRQLANLYSVQTAYYNAMGQRQEAESESLLTTLRLLGAAVETYEDIPAALRERRQALWQRGVEPVMVAWDGHLTGLELRLPATQAEGPLICHLQTEAGHVQRWENDMARLSTQQTAKVEGVSYLTKQLPLPETLPFGYHRLTLEICDHRFETLLVAAPQRAYAPADGSAPREWGIFVPPYAVHSDQSWGGGDFSDLEALATWLAELGGGVIATLPLLSSFLSEPFDPSPYSPASRLFWNEFYIDVTRAPGLEACPTAQNLLASGDVQAVLAELRAAPLVDYRRQMALKRRILEVLAEWFFDTAAAQHDGFQQYVATHSAVEDYARFRAAGERQQAPWPAWPMPLRDGVLEHKDYDERARRYHLYAQWVTHEQLTTFADRSKAGGVKLYLDLPLGVHPYSYDVWRERDVFVSDVTGGCPPDVVFTHGQNWGFSPLHPEAIRMQGYRYCLDYLRHQFRQTGLLRIDHVMGLHRFFWIPKGLEPRQGVYVRYAAEELYALLNLESHRHQVCIVGENLGTVPTYVNRTMTRHRLYSMYVVQYELTPKSKGTLRRVPQHTVASLNTHDMPPFAAYWQGLDITDRLEQGLLDAVEARREQRARQILHRALQQFLHKHGLLTESNTDLPAVLNACLAFLSGSPAQVVLVNLEDLWLETQPQNFPGTREERPNWQRKTRYSLDAVYHMPQVLAILRTLHHLRKQTQRMTVLYGGYEGASKAPL